MARRLLHSRFQIRKRMRKNFLINPFFQVRFVIFMIIVSTISMGMTFIMFKLCFQEFYQLADSSNLANNHPFRDLIQYQEGQFVTFFIILAVSNVILITLMGLWMSHRIAGPIYRITKNLLDPNFGGKISTREDDYFKELPEAINRVLKP